MTTLVRLPWIPTLGAEFHLAYDGFSLLLVALTVLLTLLAGIGSRIRSLSLYACLALTALFATGVFLAADLLLFFVCWELTLIPIFFVISQWGGERRQYAAIKFLIYTNLGGMLMLLGILLLYLEHRTFDYQTLLSRPAGALVFWAFFAGCAVKVPMVPLHTWLPDAHTEAPTAGSVLLAGVLLKLGTYGLLRFGVPLAPEAARSAAPWLAILSLVAILYGGLISLMQRDWKRLIAYSSVAHLGFCTLGLFTLNPTGIAGSMLQQLNHGVTTSLLFLIVGAAYDRTHRREIDHYGGISKTAPAFAMVFLIAVLGSMGMPPLNGFVGELTILRGVIPVSVPWAVAAGAGIALGAAYLIWLFQRVTLGRTKIGFSDLTAQEWVAVGPLVLLTIGMGVYPAPWLAWLEPAARSLAALAAR